MVGAIVSQMAALAQRAQIARIVVCWIVVEVGDAQHHRGAGKRMGLTVGGSAIGV